MVDIHSHLLYGVDDGSNDISMTLQMIKKAINEGISDQFLTSHSGCNIEVYENNFYTLKEMISTLNLKYNIYKGMEINGDIDPYIVLEQIETNEILTLNNTRYILIEFYNVSNIKIIKHYLKKYIDYGYIPIIAHAERYINLYDNIKNDINKLKELGSLIQINLWSINQEQNQKVKNNAITLIKNELVDFIGTDAHKINHRNIEAKIGSDIIKDMCKEEYAEQILKENAYKYLIRGCHENFYQTVT